MRLRLTIRRHGLPPTQILWTVADAPSNEHGSGTAIVSQSHPHAASGHPSATIAQLLEDINDVVPLESSDWGLEDYVVEVGGYECLHYTPIMDVLRDQDQVLIRALQTNDLRVRKLSGRHQITQDGRHLIDGVAFGRPYLKKNARPEVYIPPRKKPRLDLDNDEPDQITAMLDFGPSKLLIEGSSTSMGQIIEDETSDESDANFSEEDDGDMADDTDSDEVAIAEELRLLHEDLNGSVHSTASGEHNLDSGDAISDRSGALLRRGSRQVRFHDSIDAEDSSSEDSEVVEDDALAAQIPTSSSTTSRATNQKETRHSIGPGKVRNGSQQTSTQGDTHSSTSSMPQRLLPTANDIRMTAEFEDADVDSDWTSSDSTTDSSSDGSSETSSDEESGEDEDVRPLSLSRAAGTDPHETSSDSQTESSSQISDSSSDDSSTTDESSSEFDSEIEITAGLPEKTNTIRPLVPPGQGLPRTQRNNNRLKKRRRLQALKDEGILPANANFADLEAYDNSQANQEGQALIVDSSGMNNIEARKTELLDELADRDEIAAGEAPPTFAVEGDDTQMSGQIPFQDRSSKLSEPASEPKSSAKPDTRRSKLDIASTRRLLFGSLGVRAPKTVEEETKLRAKLAGKDRETKKTSRPNSGHDGIIREELEMSQSNGRWQSKIVLSAVECEVKGVTMEPPPFPFEQNWTRKGETTMNGLEQSGYTGRKVQHHHLQFDDKLDAADQYPESRLGAPILEGEAAHSPETVQDLPPPPEDLSGLKTFELEDAQYGAIIVFQELEVSAATGWTPEVSSVKTAKIERVDHDGIFEVMLALRDVPARHSEVDANTGKPIYNKFDVPAQEDEEAADPRYKQVVFENLINAKLLVGAVGESVNDSNESIQRIPESFPEGQGTTHPIGDSPDVSLTALNVQASQREDAASNHDADLVTTATSFDQSLVRNHEHSPIAASKKQSEHAPRETPGKQLRDGMAEELTTSNIHYEIDSPQFHGFSSPPGDEESVSQVLISSSQPRVPDGAETDGAAAQTIEETAAVPITPEATSLDIQPLEQDETNSQAVWQENGETVLGSQGSNGMGDDSVITVGSSIPATRSPPVPATSSSSSKRGRLKSFSQGLDGSLALDEELSSSEQIASHVRTSQVAPPPTKRQGKRKRTGTDKACQSTSSPSDSQRSKLRSQTNSSQGPSMIDSTQNSDPMSVVSSDGDLADTEAQRTPGSGWMKTNGLSMRRSRIGAGKRKK